MRSDSGGGEGKGKGGRACANLGLTCPLNPTVFLAIWSSLGETIGNPLSPTPNKKGEKVDFLSHPIWGLFLP